MEEKELQQEAQVIVEEDKDYDELLKKFENPTEFKKPKKSKKGLGIAVGVLAVALLAGGVTAMLLNPVDDDSDLQTTAEITADTNDNNVWQVTPVTDDNGKIKQNGTGTLVEYTPAQIEKIKVENQFDTYTLKSFTATETTTDPSTGEEDTTTSSTQYTLVGYEDFALEDGDPDSLASDCSAVSFNKIIEADATDNLADYGLDAPRAVATVTYTDGRKAVIRVGNDALQGLGVYIAFGDSNAVYITDSDSVDTLLTGMKDLISLTINETADDSESSDFQYINLTGSAYGEKITLKMNDDTESITDSFKLTAPYDEFAENEVASSVSGAVRGLMAEEVVSLSPTAKELKKYGLSAKYACLDAEYPDVKVNLIASQPDEDGKCYLMKKGGDIVYLISADTIPWVTTTLEDLTSNYILSAKLQGLFSVKVNAGGKDYSFRTKTVTTESTDDNGSTTESTTTTIEYNSGQITTGYFQTYFNNFALLKKSDKTKDNPSGKADLTITYDFSGDRETQVVKFFKAKNNRHIVTVDSKPVGYVYSSYVNKIIDQTSDIAKDKQVDSFW